jgi:thioredoxin 1
MSLQKLTESEFQSQVLASPLPALVDFSTKWCPPCRALEPILASLAREKAGQLTIHTVDAEESEALARRYDVRAFPTVIAFSGGREVGRAVGLMPKDRLLRTLRLHLQPAGVQAHAVPEEQTQVALSPHAPGTAASQIMVQK